MSSPVSLPELPFDVVEIILLNLPVTSLLKFKSVSKSWLSTISTPTFSKTHLTNSKEAGNFSRLLLSCDLAKRYYQYMLSTPTPNIQLQQQLLPINSNKKNTIQIAGSCNGLVCLLFEKKQLILWNPCIRKHKHVPNFVVPESYELWRFEFGFDDVANDYKIVGSFGDNDSNDSRYECKMIIFSFKIGQWKTIGSTPWPRSIYPTPSEMPPFGNGKFYSMIREFKESKERSIVVWSVCYLELATEVFRKFDLPEWINKEVKSYCTLALSEQKLVHVIGFCYTQAHVWIMKEVVGGNDADWTKLCFIDCAKPGERIRSASAFDCSFLVLNNGDIMLLFSITRIFIYNVKDGSLRQCNITSPDRSVEACTYIESLVWL